MFLSSLIALSLAMMLSPNVQLETVVVGVKTIEKVYFTKPISHSFVLAYNHA